MVAARVFPNVYKHILGYTKVVGEILSLARLPVPPLSLNNLRESITFRWLFQGLFTLAAGCRARAHGLTSNPVFCRMASGSDWRIASCRRRIALNLGKLVFDAREALIRPRRERHKVRLEARLIANQGGDSLFEPPVTAVSSRHSSFVLFARSL